MHISQQYVIQDHQVRNGIHGDTKNGIHGDTKNGIYGDTKNGFYGETDSFRHKRREVEVTNNFRVQLWTV